MSIGIVIHREVLRGNRNCFVASVSDSESEPSPENSVLGMWDLSLGLIRPHSEKTRLTGTGVVGCSRSSLVVLTEVSIKAMSMIPNGTYGTYAFGTGWCSA
jgi:hypothetical protein